MNTITASAFWRSATGRVASFTIMVAPHRLRRRFGRLVERPRQLEFF